jgi:hypothetical protein
MNFIEDESVQKYILSKIHPASKLIEETIAHFPSGLMGCMRSRYFSWMSREDLQRDFGELMLETTIDEDWLQGQSIFKMGNAVEAELGEWLSMAGLLPSPERKQFRIRSRKFLISGNIDFLILWEGKDIPIECKSAKKEKFESWGGWCCTNCGEKLRKDATRCKGCNMEGPRLEHKWLRIGFDRSPSIDHYAQLQSYLNVGDFEYGYLYYYNKNDSTRKWWRVERDEEFWKGIVAQNEALIDAVNARRIPERQYSAQFDLNGDMKDTSDWQCRWCDWSRICWADEIRHNLSEREKEISRLFGGV